VTSQKLSGEIAHGKKYNFSIKFFEVSCADFTINALKTENFNSVTTSGTTNCRSRGGECGPVGRCGNGPALYDEDCNCKKNNKDLAKSLFIIAN